MSKSSCAMAKNSERKREFDIREPLRPPDVRKVYGETCGCAARCAESLRLSGGAPINSGEATPRAVRRSRTKTVRRRSTARQSLAAHQAAEPLMSNSGLPNG